MFRAERESITEKESDTGDKTVAQSNPEKNGESRKNLKRKKGSKNH